MARIIKNIGVATWVLVTATACGSSSQAMSSGQNACRMTSQQMVTSCQAGARSDNFLAQAACLNLSDAAAKKACRQQAATDFGDAQQTCKDQYDARQTACTRLGPAPYDPVIVPANFVATIDNPFFPLHPGTTFIYEGQTAQGLEHVEFAVTHNTKVILGVTCIEVHDTVVTGGVLTEDTLDWFAQDTAGNVWYFGENSKQLAGGLIVGVEGSWTGGVGGGKPGIVMEAHPAISDFYRQEFLLDTAEDLAEVISLSEAVTVPYGSFTNCPETAETSGLEPDGLEHKFYAAGIGNLRTVDLVTGDISDLVQITTN